MNEHRRDQILGTLFVAGVGIVLYMFWPAIIDWISNLFPPQVVSLQETMQKHGIQGVAPAEPIPFSTRVVGWLWQTIGALIAGAVLVAVYFATAMAGRTNQSGVHGIAGIVIGLALLIFMTAFLYSEGYSFWTSVLVGAIVSVSLKLFFSYLRMRLRGDAQPQGMHYIYHRRVIRRE